MNRGLALALLLLAFTITLVGASTILVKDRVAENEALLSALDPKEPATETDFSAVRLAYEDARFVFSISVPLGYLNEYEEALAALEASVFSWAVWLSLSISPSLRQITLKNALKILE